MRRILIEQRDGAVSDVMTRTLRKAGFEVETCPGPQAFRGHRCPLVETGQCASAREADVIVFGLPLATPENREILDAHGVYFPGKPVVVEVSQWQADVYEDHLTDAHRMDYPVTRESLVETVRGALTEE